MEFIEKYRNKLNYMYISFILFCAQNKINYFNFINKNFNMCKDIIDIICDYMF